MWAPRGLGDLEIRAICFQVAGKQSGNYFKGSG